jgi:WD40 repeat protein
MVNWSEPDTVTVHREFPDFAAAIISDKDGPADQSACLLDLKTGRREPLPWPPPVAEESRLTAGGRYLVYVTGRSKPFVTYWWDRTSRQVVGAFPGLTPSAVAADGRWVTVESAGAGTDRKRISVREPASGRVTVQFDRPGAVESVWFSPDGGYLVVSGDRALQVAELPSGRLCPSSLPWTPLVEIVPGLRQAITDHWEGNRPLTRWDLTTGQPVGDCHTPPDVQPEHVRSDSPLIVFGSWRDTEALTPIRAFLTKVPVVGRILPADGKWFMIYDPATDGEVARIRPSNPWEVHLSPDGRTFVSASLDGQLEFWDVPPRKPLTWFAIAAGVWALPVAWLARRRTRRLVNAEW